MSPIIQGIDWDKVAGGQLVPEGRHTARVSDIEERMSAKENPYINIEFTITDDSALGRKVWDVFMLNAEALWKLRNLAKAVGIDLAGTSDFDTENLKEQEVGLIVGHETYEGQVRSRVKGYFPAK